MHFLASVSVTGTMLTFQMLLWTTASSSGVNNSQCDTVDVSISRVNFKREEAARSEKKLGESEILLHKN